MTAWVASAAAGLLFASNTWFAGPGASLVGGADIGFVVAGVVAAVAYPLMLKVFLEPREVFGDEPHDASTALRRRRLPALKRE